MDFQKVLRTICLHTTKYPFDSESINFKILKQPRIFSFFLFDINSVVFEWANIKSETILILAKQIFSLYNLFNIYENDFYLRAISIKQNSCSVFTFYVARYVHFTSRFHSNIVT